MRMPRSLLVVVMVAGLMVVMLGNAQAVVGARAIAMGGAFVGLADDASATYWNPAALPFLPSSAVMYSGALSNRDESPARDFLTCVTPFDENNSIGISYARVMLASISAYNSSLDWDQTWWWFSYGYRVTPTTGVGLNVRWVDDDAQATEDGQPLEVSADSDFGVDLAVYHQFNAEVSAGLLIQNANEPGSALRFPDASVLEGEWVRTFDPGVAVRVPEGDLTMVAQIHDLTDAVGRGFRVGVEQRLPGDTFSAALRAGWWQDAGTLTFGGGLGYQDWQLDLAYAAGDFNGTWFVSLTGNF